MPINHAPAILRWREHAEKQSGGLSKLDEPATVSTMLFGCNSWLATAAADDPETAKIQAIKLELETWLGAKGMSFRG